MNAEIKLYCEACIEKAVLLKKIQPMTGTVQFKTSATCHLCGDVGEPTEKFYRNKDFDEVLESAERILSSSESNKDANDATKLLLSNDMKNKLGI